MGLSAFLEQGLSEPEFNSEFNSDSQSIFIATITRPKSCFKKEIISKFVVYTCN